MSNQLNIEVYNNIASGAPPIQVIETEASNSSIFVQPLEHVAPINIQIHDNTTSGIFPVQVIQSEFTGVPIYIQVQENYAPVQAVNGQIGWVTIDKNDIGLSNVDNISILSVLNSLTGLNSGIIVISGDFTPYATNVNLALTGSTLNTLINSLSGTLTGNYYPRNNPSGFITGVDLSNYVTGSVVRPSETGAFYPRSNPSGFITGVDLSNYVTGSVVRPSETGAFYPRSNPSGFLVSGQGLPTGGLGGQVLVKTNEYQNYLTNWRYLTAQDVNAAEKLNSVSFHIPSGADNTPVIENMINTGSSTVNDIFLTGVNQYYGITKQSHKDLTISLPTFANFGDRIAVRRDDPVQDNNKGVFIINRLGGQPFVQTISVLPRAGNIFYCIWIGLWVPDFVPPAGFEGAPLSSTSFGVPGQMSYEEPYLYICVNNNQWRRIAISDWDN